MSGSKYTAGGINSYTVYDQDHDYEYDKGLVVLPVAGATPKHRIIRLHGGLGIRRVKWHAQRRGKPPVVPSMEDTTWDTFLGGTATAALPQYDAQSCGYNWKVTGEYVFVQQEPRIVGTNTLPTGGYPFPVAPNDAVGAALAQPQLAGFTNSDPDVNGFDGLADAIGNAVVEHDSDEYVWPFTFFPPIFSTDTLIGA